MSRIRCEGREVDLSYSTNVHPAETLDELLAMLRQNVAPVSRGAFGERQACVNLRLGMAQVDELLGHPTLPTTSTLSDEILSAPPTSRCKDLRSTLKELQLRVTSINGFPIRAFHAPRVKEQVYSPPWTDGGRVLYTIKIAKAFAHLLGDRREGAVSVPSGTFKGYTDNDEIKAQCAHFLTECVRELARLERLTGKTVRLGLEPEPFTTGESVDEFIDYYTRFILPAAKDKLPLQMHLPAADVEKLTRKFLTVNLDLCHQAVEFEDPIEDLKKFRAAGIVVTGLHLSAALKVPEPAANAAAYEQLLALNEPRYLHQVVARKRDGTLARFEDLPDLKNPKRLKGLTVSDFAEVRCHFHVPLFADFPGPLASTRDVVAPAARFAVREGITDNLVVETYTWNVLNDLAKAGVASAQSIVGAGGIDVNAGLIREMQWTIQGLQGRA
jgi:hypothetical protein